MERDKIRAATAKHGTRAALARRLEIHPHYLLWLLAGGRPGRHLAKDIAEAVPGVDAERLRAESRQLAAV